jgi:hypothetical protein
MATQILKPTKTESLDRNATASESKSQAKEMRSNIEAINATTHAPSGQPLLYSEARYRRLFETAQDGILIRELMARRYVRYEDLPLKTKGGRSVNVEFVSNV